MRSLAVAYFTFRNLNIITMNNVTLQFPSTHILWLFRRTISLVSLQVNHALRTLTCDCYEEDINIALSSFGAEIIEINTPASLNYIKETR
jgi:hypothetical protein